MSYLCTVNQVGSLISMVIPLFWVANIEKRAISMKKSLKSENFQKIKGFEVGNIPKGLHTCT